MKHPSEDQWVLYYYGESPDQGDFEEHLAGCRQCRAGYDELARVLNAVDAAPVPELSDAYGAMMWRRVESRLDPPRSKMPLFSRWAAVAAMALLLIVAFMAGRFSTWPVPAPARTVAVNTEQVRERVLLVAVGEHLERSQVVLIELVNGKAKSPVEDLIDANRLYRQAAAGSGNTGMIYVLDELERVLLEVEHGPSSLSPAAIDKVREVLFKLRVVGSTVREREDKSL